MGPKRDSKINSTSFPSRTANNQDNILEEIKQLIATTSARFEKRIDSVEDRIKSQRDEVNNIEVKDNKEISLQSFTKYLRLTLVFMWNSVLCQKFNFCFSRVFC